MFIKDDIIWRPAKGSYLILIVPDNGIQCTVINAGGEIIPEQRRTWGAEWGLYERLENLKTIKPEYLTMLKSSDIDTVSFAIEVLKNQTKDVEKR